MDNLIREEQNRPSLQSPTDLFLSMLGIGLSPKAPGTIASIATIILLYSLSLLKIPHFIYIPFFIVTLAGATLIAHTRTKNLSMPDQQWIVIDEFLGTFLTWIIASPKTILGHLIVLTLFRIFDIYKPWPVNIIDQNWDHGAAIIFDDIMAAIYAGVLSLLLLKFF